MGLQRTMELSNGLLADPALGNVSLVEGGCASKVQAGGLPRAIGSLRAKTQKFSAPPASRSIRDGNYITAVATYY